MNFFTKNELNFFKTIAGTAYKARDDESTAKKERLMPVVEKSNAWADLLRNRLPDFKVENNRYWQTGRTFRKYTWHKIYRDEDKDKLIFFTIGVDGSNGSLLIKLDCMRESFGQGEVLPDEKIERFYDFLSGQDVKKIILNTELDVWNWNRLVDFSAELVRNNEDLYEDVIKYVHNLSLPTHSYQTNTEFVNVSQPPSEIKSRIKKRERTFSGVQRDWEKEYRRSQRLGAQGEKFIKRQEQLKLKNADLELKSENVEKVLDGMGYDIHSFDLNGRDIFIEVKTTTGNNKTPFYISENEKAFCEMNKSKYFIYRVYNFDRDLQKGDYFILNGEELAKRGNFTPTSFEVTIKRDST